jgi:histidyl-tRNA synthetase
LEECLCDECKAHFDGLKELLTAAGVDYVVDHNLVRGLDYYTKTAFEIQYSPLGAQSAVCGGGRYDGLIEEVGGPATPGIGFAMGMERVLLALESQNLLPAADDSMDIFVVCPKQENFTVAFKTAIELRRAGFKVDYDFQGRSMKAQMKAANRVQAKYVLIFGEDEVARGQVVLRNMANSEQNEIAISDILTKLQTEV